MVLPKRFGVTKTWPDRQLKK